MENKQREERETERPRRRDGHMQNRIHGLLRSARTLPCTPSLSITCTVSLHTHTHIPHVKAYTDALLVRRRERERERVFAWMTQLGLCQF